MRLEQSNTQLYNKDKEQSKNIINETTSENIPNGNNTIYNISEKIDTSKTKVGLLYDSSITGNSLNIKQLQELFYKIIDKITAISLIDSDIQYSSDFSREIHAIIKEISESIILKLDTQQKINKKEIKSFKKIIHAKTLQTLKKIILKEKSYDFCEDVTIENISDFEKYYYKIMPLEFKDKEKVGLEDTLKRETLEKSDKDITSLTSILNSLCTAYSIDLKTKKLNLNLSGGMKCVNDDEVIVEMGDIIPYLTPNQIIRSKKQIILLTKLIFELLIRQFPSLSQINFFCSIFYAKKSKEINSLRNMEYEENIAFSFINLQ